MIHFTSAAKRGIIADARCAMTPFGRAAFLNAPRLQPWSVFLLQAIQIEFIILFLADSLNNQVIVFLEIMQPRDDCRF